MKLHCFTVGLFQVNAWLIEDPATGACALVDTGEGDDVAEALAALDPRPDLRVILLTHAHFDHAGGLVPLQALYPQAETCLPRLEQPMFDLLPRQGEIFGAAQFSKPCGRIDRCIDDGDTVQVGALEARFVSTPGHTPGQGCWQVDGHLFVGDTIFAGSVGRTDFPLSDPALAQKSLAKLMTLPGELVVHCGHGPDTTLAAELKSNPYLAHVRRALGIKEPRGGFAYGGNWG